MSRQYKNPDDVPNDVICKRLKELSKAATTGRDAILREFTMRIPAELDRDPDLVLGIAARRIRKLAKAQETEGCSVCGTKPALCADKFDKGTYFLCSGCLSERTTENGRLNQALDDLAEDCPTCDNSGLTIVGRQCEYCYANKLSTFNINVLKIQAVTGKERYDVIRDFIQPDSELDT